MDSSDSKIDYFETRRRSIRQAHKNAAVLGVDVKARSALKRRREVKKDGGSAVKESEEKHNSANEETGSKNKAPRLQMAGDVEDGHEKGDTNVTVEMDEAEHSDQDMSSEDESETCEMMAKTTKPLIDEKSVIRTVHVGNLETEQLRIFLRKQRMQECQPKAPTAKGDQETTCGSQTSSREASRTIHFIPVENRPEVLTVRSSIRQYRDKMEQKARGVSNSSIPSMARYACSEGDARIQQSNVIPAKKQPMQHKSTELKKPVTTKATSASYSRGYVWYMWAFFLLASLALGLVGYQHLPASCFPTRTTHHQDRMVSHANFEAQLAALKTSFPSQRSTLWKRTEIHLKRHLNLTDPSEPVSMILTAGHGAEKTLGCLAQRLATAFSTALNSSIVEIDGASKALQDSDQVKLDIDKALQEAFDNGQQAAVIHRFEELPPGSTLIFYRYCDHENAAYKNVFLSFTVLLPEADLHSGVSLSELEEQVQEYLKNKFVSSNRTSAFNQMDVDKLSGLWSRISHLILPVVAEKMIEQYGCGG